MALEQELNTYNAYLKEWADREGKFVLIRGEEVCGFYSSFEDALQIGYERFHREPFFVKQVHLLEQTHTFTRPLAPCLTSPAP